MIPDPDLDLVNARASIQYIAERVRKGSLPQVAEELLIVRETLNIVARSLRSVVSAYSMGHRPSPDTIHDLQQLLANYKDEDWILPEIKP